MLKRPSDEVVNAMHWCYLAASVACALAMAMAGVLRVAVAGELTLQLRMPSAQAAPRAFSHYPKATSESPRECVQLPQRVHLDAMLSHMMNELTKVVVLAQRLVRREQTRGRPARYAVRSRPLMDFFDGVYANMTDDYRRFFNETVEDAAVSRLAPCRHQDEIRRLWRGLLDSSEEALRSAATSIAGQLVRGGALRGGQGRRVLGLVARTLRHQRAQQMGLLCDVYRLCFDDLLPEQTAASQ